jgi:peptidoglycan/LPS O-acetylase OafA/YrhL
MAELTGLRGIVFLGPVGRLLKSPALIYLGTISYGIYVLHPFTAPFMRLAIGHFGLGEALLESTYWFSVKFAGTLALASLSWYLLERPIHRLKRLFPYR